MTTASLVTITHLDANDPAALHHHYDRQQEPQPTFLALDTENGTLYADYSGEVGTPRAISMREYNQIVLTWDIPLMTAATVNDLLDEVTPLAERIMAGASIKWNGNNHVGILDEDATAANAELAELVQTLDPTLVEMPADLWFSEGVVDDLDADTTDDELAAIVAREEEDAAHSDRDAYTVLVDADKFLEAERERMRKQVREELEETAQEIAALTEKRDDLIRRCMAFGDSSRELAKLTDLSHTTIQAINRRAGESS